jgi:hypothetical protein
MTERIVLTLCFMLGLVACGHSSPPQGQSQGQSQGQAAPMDPAALDKVLAPIALYPDALVAQILMCSTNAAKVRDLQAFMQKNKNLKGTQLQEAAGKQGFDPSYVALTLFPQVVKTMNDSIGWTRQMGQAFNADKKAVFESVQRLRKLAVDVGNLKTTAQQEVQNVDQNGQQVIVIQPANPQVVYVPQYNPETVYIQAPPATQTIVVHEDDDSMDAAAAGMIGFGVGVAMGAAMNSNYYHGPYGWGGYGMYGGYYGAGYNDVLDHREDMMDDYYDHREDMQENRKDMAEDRDGKTASERQSSRQQSSTERQAGRDQNSSERQANRQSGTSPSATRQSGTSQSASSRQAGTTPSTSDRQTSRQAGGASASTQNLGSRSQAGGAGVSSLPSGYESRGYGQSGSQVSSQRSSSGAGGFSGYERGSSTRSTSSRGRSSMGGGGGGRSRGGGGGRRR